MKKDAIEIIVECLTEKMTDLRLIVRSDLAKLSLSQLEKLNNQIADLEYALKELKGDK